MEENIYQLVYVSSAIQLFSEEELLNLLEVARSNNKRQDITGLLLYHEGCFIQLLEGDMESVESLFLTISKDPRLKGTIKLQGKYVAERDFPEWSMGFKTMTRNAIEGFDDYILQRTVDDGAVEKFSCNVKAYLNTFRMTSGLAQI